MEHWIFMKLSYIYETFNLFNLRSAFLYCRFHWSGQSFLPVSYTHLTLPTIA